MLKFTDVLVEYRKNPIGIDNRTPIFGWKYEQATDALQRSYRIEVAGSEQLLATGCADLWDSGEVFSSAQNGVEYAGKPLCSSQVAYVRVTVMDGKGEVSTSPVASFEMGLLEEDDWKGKWVSMPVSFQGGALQFRKELEIPTDKPIDRARIYVCAVGYHELYFNGKKVTDYVLHPAVTEYGRTVEYTTYDVTPYLADRNVIGVLVGHGWLGDRKLLAQINVHYKDGTVFEDHTQNCWGWWMSGSPIVEDSIYGGETYDARLEDDYEGWATADYRSGWDNGWLYTFLTAPVQGVKRAMSVNPIRVCDCRSIKSLKKQDKGHFLVDAGVNLAGWLRVKATGERGAKMILRYAEDLKDGRINRINLRSAACTDTYIFRGKGEEEYAPRFTYHGFRYVEIEIVGKVSLGGIIVEHVHSDVAPIGEFRCGNPIINKLHENAVLTEASNLHSIMTDCPQRDERLGWLNDLSSRIYQTVNNFSMESFFPKVIRDITETQNERGEIADTAPFYTGSRPADPVSVCYLLFALESYRRYGNARVLKEQYHGFKAWTESLLEKQQGYIMNYTYYNDWVPPATFEDVRTDGLYISSVYLYWHLVCLARIAGIIGKQSDRKKYLKHARNAKKAIVEKYFDGEKFSTGTQCENSVALSLGLCPRGAEGKLAATVASDIVAHGKHSTCGNQGYRHMFYALSDAGYNDLLLEMITNPEYPGWGYMISQGATSVWERWEKKMENEMHSFNHPMFGSYDGWLYNCVAGIDVAADAVGGGKVTVAPHPADGFGSVSASVQTARGRVSCSYRRTATGRIYDIQIPTNTTATIVMPGKILSVNGKKFAGCRLEVLSGEYRIVTREK